MKTIRILLANDDAALPEAVSAVLGSERVDCVATARTLADALALYASRQPDVVVMHHQFDGRAQGRAATTLRRAHPRARIVLCSRYDQEALFLERLLSASQP